MGCKCGETQAIGPDCKSMRKTSFDGRRRCSSRSVGQVIPARGA
jgi:hypothetical protein